MQIGKQVWLLLALLGASTAQAELYRYVSQHGVVVLDSQGVPPEYVGRGYEVLDADGRVLRVVPPAPTAEELRQRAEAQRQAEADAQLRQRYASVADLEQTRRQRLRDLDALLAMAQANLQGVQGQMRARERQAAERQRAGQAVQPGLLEQLESMAGDQRRLEADLQRLQAQRTALEAEFARDRARLVELAGREG
ncbi:hypothetical protein D9M71_267280 [compost metagenome]|uniref:DUF4124 domain-containing protein n=1 Tax=Pseudomonas linyingensis TaxID=915471 RepID=A0A1H7B873_9PSED|nr:DUF4124 domain-containing protein [Pseudomonas linyingensis]SEJ73981.1 hypothetical protein SAMN05216201_11622 [Pseudomonas linyingensis]